jgi:transketolase
MPRLETVAPASNFPLRFVTIQPGQKVSENTNILKGTTMAAQTGKGAASDLEQLAINTIRTLSMDAVQAANSGHPGAPMGMAPTGYVLWQRILRYDPQDPIWPNRDRFVLSAGHASMLLYSILHLAGVKEVSADYKVLSSPAV